MAFEFRGVPVREIHGLPFSVHQVSDNGWQVVVQNCARHPAGYTFAPVYASYEEAMNALEHWGADGTAEQTNVSGDDTGAAYLARYED